MQWLASSLIKGTWLRWLQMQKSTSLYGFSEVNTTQPTALTRVPLKAGLQTRLQQILANVSIYAVVAGPGLRATVCLIIPQITPIPPASTSPSPPAKNRSVLTLHLDCGKRDSKLQNS